MSPRVVGALAAAAGLVVSELVAAAVGAAETPLLAVAQTAIRWTPGSAAETIIGAVGDLDKPLAVAVTLLAVLLLGSLVGRWWAERRTWAWAGIGVLVAASVAAVLIRPEPSIGKVAAAVAGGAAFVGVLGWTSTLRTRAMAGDQEEPQVSRRQLVAVVVGLAVVTAVGGGLSQWFAGRRRRREEIEVARRSLAEPGSDLTVPPGADLEIADQAPWRTSNREFYRIDTALQPPLVDPSEWSLRIHGMVAEERTMTYAELVDRGLRSVWITLCCVSNQVGGALISNAVFAGVPIRDLLAEVGVDDDADMLLSTSHDGWTCGTPLEVLTDDRDALLAVGMNGEPLPVEHGFPVRQVVPGLYGYVSATKWVVDWELTRFDRAEAYWTGRGWGERGPVKTQSRIDVPAEAAEVAAGPVTVAGVAWAQQTGIERVEVRLDEGEWVDAELGAVPSVDTWVQWRWEWQATETGRHVLQVRATDATGETQTGERVGVLPDGATGWHTVNVNVV